MAGVEPGHVTVFDTRSNGGDVVFITDAGPLWLDVVDNWCNNYGLVTVGLLQCLVGGWFVKTKLLTDAINEGAEIRVGKWWLACIKIITPAILITLLALNLRKELLIEAYEGYPLWALITGGWAVIAGAFILSIVLMLTRGQEAAE